MSRWVDFEQERPLDVTADSDPFDQESNIRELKRRLDAIKDGTAVLEEHDLIEVE